MNRFLIRFWFLIVAGVLLGSIIISGCGTKIGIPEPEGLFSIPSYKEDASYDDDAVQLAVSQGTIFVIGVDSLHKRDLEYVQVAAVGGLQSPQSLCIDEMGQLVFVWNQGNHQVDWYSTSDLALVGSSAPLPEVQSGQAMATSWRGIDQIAGAGTFLYISDPDSGVVHRYVFDEFNGLAPNGILCRSGGDAARFVHQPLGLARDWQDHLLVCDVDTNRNWVIRFDGTPDLEDVTQDEDDQDPLRGFAALFTDPVCPIPAANEYVLGNAASCNQSDWVGGTSTSQGEFHSPSFVAVDGSGQIFVSDTWNNRVQIFSAQGDLKDIFGSGDGLYPSPGSLGVVDVRVASGADGVHYGAYVYLLVPLENQVRRFISPEHYSTVYGDIPPEE